VLKDHADRCGGLREHTLTAFALISCVCGAETWAKDQSAGVAAPLKLNKESLALSAPSLRLDEPRIYSATEFRPRRPGLGGAEAVQHETFVFAPMNDSSVARQLRDSKSQDRVRLLTLWRSSASSVSLQAGKHGMPSLQWSTPWMQRGAASGGLFDRLLILSPRSGAAGHVTAPRQASAFAVGKPADLNASLGNK